MGTIGHFDSHAADYLRYRPRYPEHLFDWLSQVAPARGVAWDCAAGSGQVAGALTRRFGRVLATDAALASLKLCAPGTRNLERIAARAEAVPLGDDAVDLVAVGQAAHWFDWPVFRSEARRVLRPGGVLAFWGYRRLHAEGEGIEALLNELDRRLAGDWPTGRLELERGYANLDPGGIELAPPAVELVADWDLERLLGYLGTWSAVARHRTLHGSDPLGALAPRLRENWGSSTTCRFRWPVTVRAARYD